MASQDAVYAFFYLHLSALISIPLLLLTIALSRGSAKRDPTVISLLVIYGVISPVAYDLFLFRTAGGLPAESGGVCLAQAGLATGAQSLQAAGLLGLVVKLFSELLAVSRRKQSILDSTVVQILLLNFPYALWLSGLVATVSLARDGVQGGNVVSGDLFCSLDNHALTKTFAVLNVTLFVLVAAFLLCALVLVIRRYISFRHLGGEVVSPSSLLVAFSEVDVGLACRVVLFASYVGLAFGTSTLLLSERYPLIWDMSSAAAGPIIFLTFGSQSDILHIWTHPFRLLLYRLSSATTSSSTFSTRPSTPTLLHTTTSQIDPFPPHTIHLSPTRPNAVPPPSPTASVGLNTMLTRGSSFRSTLDWSGGMPRTPSPCLWTKDGRWRQSLLVEEGGEAKELSFPMGEGESEGDVFGKVAMSKEEREWREGMRKREEELAREVRRVKKEAEGVRRELEGLRVEVGELRRRGEEEDGVGRGEEEGNGDEGEGEEREQEEEPGERWSETESEVSWGDEAVRRSEARERELRGRPSTPTFR